MRGDVFSIFDSRNDAYLYAIRRGPVKFFHLTYLSRKTKTRRYDAKYWRVFATITNYTTKYIRDNRRSVHTTTGPSRRGITKTSLRLRTFAK